jgi:WD40 repeat protein
LLEKRPRRTSAARLFGYDFFISFALGPLPRGTQSYASDLARRLRERDFSVFFSEDEASPGEPLTPTLRAALHRSRVLVVVANRETLAQPRWVRTEVEEFRVRRPGRPVIPISVGGALEDASLAQTTETWLGHQEKIWLDESEQAVANGIASDVLVDRLVLAPARLSSNVRWRWLVRSVIIGLLALTITSILAAIYAVRQRDEAYRQNTLAQGGRLAAEAELLLERGGAADASVMVALEGVRTLNSIGERSFDVDLALRRGLMLLPQSHGEFDNTAAEARLSAGGDYVAFTDLARRMSVRQLPGGEHRSCRDSDIKVATGTDANRRITAASTNGEWCVIEEDRDGNRNQVTLEVWSARPSQRVGSVSVQSQSGHLYTAINDDGSVVAITDHAQPGTAVKSTFRLWSRTRRADLLRLEGEEFVGFSPDHRHFATTKGFWRLPHDDRAAPIQTTSWNEPYSLAFSRDGAYVGTRKPYDGAVRVWDVRAAQWLPPLGAPEGELLAISEAARVIILNGVEGAVVWDTQKETIRSNVPRVAGKDQYAITREVKAAAFALPDPRFLVVEYDRRSLATQRVLSLPMWGSALATTELGAHETVEWLGVRGEQIYLLITSGSVRLETWTYRSGVRNTVFTLPAGPTAVSADGRSFAVAAGGKVIVAPIGAHTPPIEIPGAPADRVALSGDGSHVVTAAAGVMQVSRVGSRESWTSAPLPAPPFTIKVSRDGAFAFAIVRGSGVTRAGEEYSLVRWRTANPADIISIDLGGHASPPSNVLCFVSDDGTFPTGDYRASTTARSEIECEAPGAPLLRLTTEDTRVTVADAVGNQPLARLDHGSKVLKSAASADGKHVATTTKDLVLVFTLDSAELIKQTCSRGPRPVTTEEWDRYIRVATANDACGRAVR